MNGQGRLTHRTEPQDLAFELGEADVTGVINNTRQDWSVKARDTHITSENFPSPQTDIKAGQARLTATLEPGAPVSFTVESPAASSNLTPAVNVTGTGVNTTLFENESNFNPRPGNATQGSEFTPQSFSIGGGGISFLAGEIYTLSFRDFANASDGNEAFVQFNDMEFFALAAPAAPPIPLPATAWMMISALGFFGWRKYRAS